MVGLKDKETIQLMKASETKLQPILSGPRQYIIPYFQRTYSWKTKQWKGLWEDLQSLYTADKEREHFLGAIVTVPMGMTPNGTGKVLLIDGQQRLTTLLIFLAVLRDIAKERDNEQLATQIEKLYLFNEFESGLECFRLLPSEGDQEVFFALMCGEPVDNNHRLSQAYSYFLKRTQRKIDKNDLGRLRRIIISNLVVVNIVLGVDENPHRIFESLNYKGEPLTQADLVRNYFFMRIPLEHHKSVYNEHWFPMQQRFAHSRRDLLGGFMWRYLLKDGTFVRRGDVYDAFKKRLDPVADDQLIPTLQDLARFADYYERLRDPTKEQDSPSLQEKLGRLKRWDVTTSYPFLLNIYEDYCEGSISVEKFRQIMDTLESFVVRRTFCRIPTNELNRLFISLYRQLDRDDLVSSLRAALCQRRWPTDEEFARGWEVFPIYKSGREKARLVLESLETACGHKEIVDVSTLQIEHVMPQTLTSEWRQILGHNADETHNTYLHTIGNLTLTGYNQPLGNKPFIRKKAEFVRSHLELNKYFKACDIWDEEAIQHRALTLFGMARRIWHRP